MGGRGLERFEMGGGGNDDDLSLLHQIGGEMLTLNDSLKGIHSKQVSEDEADIQSYLESVRGGG